MAKRQSSLKMKVTFFAAITLAALNSLAGADEYSFCNPVKRDEIKSKITFNADEIDSGHVIQKTDNMLFVGAHFIVDRNANTFTSAKLLDKVGIEILSESKLVVSSKDENKISFQSTKQLPLNSGVLICENTAEIIEWDEKIEKSFSQILPKKLIDQCLKNEKPFLLTYQRIGNCNSYFSESHVLTLYFSDTSSTTRLLSFTYSNLTPDVGWLMKVPMKFEINSEVNALPSLVESLR